MAYRIFAKVNLTGKTVALEVSGGYETVNGVMEQISSRVGIPPSRQRLLFAGERLMAYSTLADCDIGPEATLHLVCSRQDLAVAEAGTTRSYVADETMPMPMLPPPSTDAPPPAWSCDTCLRVFTSQFALNGHRRGACVDRQQGCKLAAKVGGEGVEAGGHSRNGRKCLQIDPLTHAVIRVWPSGSSAARELDISQTHISQACRGRRTSAGGFVWRFSGTNNGDCSSSLSLWPPPPPSSAVVVPDWMRAQHTANDSLLTTACGAIKLPRWMSPAAAAAAAAASVGGSLESNVRNCTCEKCGRTFSSRRALGPHRRQCSGTSNPATTATGARPTRLKSAVVVPDWMRGNGAADVTRHGRITPGKRCEQYDLVTGKSIAIFASGSDASRAVGVTQTWVSQVCLGKKASVGGYGFRYIDSGAETRSAHTNGGVAETRSTHTHGGVVLPAWMQLSTSKALSQRQHRQAPAGRKRGRPRVNAHVCDVCGRSFPTGQALGGHKAQRKSCSSSVNGDKAPRWRMWAQGNATVPHWMMLARGNGDHDGGDVLRDGNVSLPSWQQPASDQQRLPSKRRKRSATCPHCNRVFASERAFWPHMRSCRPGSEGNCSAANGGSLLPASNKRKRASAMRPCNVVVPDWMRAGSRPKGGRGGHLDPKNARVCEQFDLATGRTINTFRSGAAAARAVGISQSQVSQVCRGKLISVAGFGFRYSAYTADSAPTSTVGAVTLPSWMSPAPAAAEAASGDDSSTQLNIFTEGGSWSGSVADTQCEVCGQRFITPQGLGSHRRRCARENGRGVGALKLPRTTTTTTTALHIPAWMERGAIGGAEHTSQSVGNVTLPSWISPALGNRAPDGDGEIASRQSKRQKTARVPFEARAVDERETMGKFSCTTCGRVFTSAVGRGVHSRFCSGPSAPQASAATFSNAGGHWSALSATSTPASSAVIGALDDIINTVAAWSGGRLCLAAKRLGAQLTKPHMLHELRRIDTARTSVSKRFRPTLEKGRKSLQHKPGRRGPYKKTGTCARGRPRKNSSGNAPASTDRRRRGCLQLDAQTGEVVRAWKSGSEAARALNLNQSQISAACRGKRKHAFVGGFSWCFSDNPGLAQTSVSAQKDVLCCVCSRSTLTECDYSKVLLCDGCPAECHMPCVNITEVPKGDWFCPKCNSQRGPVRAPDWMLAADGSGGSGGFRQNHSSSPTAVRLPAWMVPAAAVAAAAAAAAAASSLPPPPAPAVACGLCGKKFGSNQVLGVHHRHCPRRPQRPAASAATEIKYHCKYCKIVGDIIQCGGTGPHHKQECPRYLVAAPEDASAKVVVNAPGFPPSGGSVTSAGGEVDTKPRPAASPSVSTGGGNGEHGNGESVRQNGRLRNRRKLNYALLNGPGSDEDDEDSLSDEEHGGAPSSAAVSTAPRASSPRSVSNGPRQQSSSTAKPASDEATARIQREFLPGAVVWAKMPRYPWWPAFVCDPAWVFQPDAREIARQKSDSGDQSLVMFFGERTFSLVDELKPFPCMRGEAGPMPDDKRLSLDEQASLRNAVAEASKEVARPGFLRCNAGFPLQRQSSVVIN